MRWQRRSHLLSPTRKRDGQREGLTSFSIQRAFRRAGMATSRGRCSSRSTGRARGSLPLRVAVWKVENEWIRQRPFDHPSRRRQDLVGTTRLRTLHSGVEVSGKPSRTPASLRNCSVCTFPWFATGEMSDCCRVRAFFLPVTTIRTFRTTLRGARPSTSVCLQGPRFVSAFSISLSRSAVQMTRTPHFENGLCLVSRRRRVRPRWAALLHSTPHTRPASLACGGAECRTSACVPRLRR